MAGDAILPTNNNNVGEVDDPVLNSKVSSLGTLFKVPTSNLSSFTSQWQALDEYATRKAYAGVWGYYTPPEFTSSRIDRGALIFQTLFGWDLSSFKVK
jgi:hypothetical protein